MRQLNPMMNPGAALITESLLEIAVQLAFIALLEPRLLAAPLLFVALFAVALRHYMRELNPVSAALRRQFGVMNAGLNETILGTEVVKASAQQRQEHEKFARDARAFRLCSTYFRHQSPDYDPEAAPA